MQIHVTGIHLDVGEALRQHVITRMTAAVGKYFDTSMDGNVTFVREGHDHRTVCSVHLGPGMTFQTHGQASDIHASFDQAVERMEKRLRRQKGRLKDRHRTPPDGRGFSRIPGA